MPRISFRLSTLLAAVALVALVIATLVTGSRWCTSLMDTVVWLALVAALITAFAGASPTRAFARGFAIVGGLYLLVAFIPALQVLPGPHRFIENIAREVHSALIPHRVRQYAHPGFQPVPKGDTYWQIGPNHFYQTWTNDWEQTHRTIDSLATILFGCLGGALAVRLQRQSSPNADASK